MSEIKMVTPMKGENIVTEIENDPDYLRATIRACLRELDEEREAVQIAAGSLERSAEEWEMKARMDDTPVEADIDGDAPAKPMFTVERCRELAAAEYERAETVRSLLPETEGEA